MIEKVSFLDSSVNCVDCKGFVHNVAEGGIINKINELVDAVNELTSCVGQLGVEFIEPKPVEFTEPNLADPYAEQRKWRGKLCKFWDDRDKPENCVYDILCNIFDLHHEDCPFQCGNGEWYEYCEPVKPDDDIIYKGEADA